MLTTIRFYFQRYIEIGKFLSLEISSQREVDLTDDEDSVIKFVVKTIQMSEFPQFDKSLLEPQLCESWDIHKWIHSDKTLHRTCPIWNCPNFLNENEFIIMSPNTPNNSCYNQPFAV